MKRNADKTAKLWLAMVEHEVVPGTRLQLFWQEAEPTDEEVFSRFAGELPAEDVKQLYVAGMFDVSCELSDENVAAFMAAAKALVQGGQGVTTPGPAAPFADPTDIIRRLVNWEQHMGGFEAQCWDEARLFLGISEPE